MPTTEAPYIIPFVSTSHPIPYNHIANFHRYVSPANPFATRTSTTNPNNKVNKTFASCFPSGQPRFFGVNGFQPCFQYCLVKDIEEQQGCRTA